MAITAFAPRQGATQKISATTTSQSITIAPGNNQLRINMTNLVTAIMCHVTTGIGSATATTADFAILAYDPTTISIPPGTDTVAVRTDAGTADIYITPGDGL